METSREKILRKIREGRPVGPQLPDVPHFSGPADTEKSFKEKLVGFNGSFIDFKTREEALKWLEDKRHTLKSPVCSVIEGFDGDLSIKNIADPHDANVIATFVANGELGVGESGSVWVTKKSLQIPACALLSTDLILLLDRSKIVGTMHEAYDRIDLASNQYGSFYSGPSATADIEAVHITGAQAEISLTILLCGKICGKN